MAFNRKILAATMPVIEMLAAKGYKAEPYSDTVLANCTGQVSDLELNVLQAPDESAKDVNACVALALEAIRSADTVDDTNPIPMYDTAIRDTVADVADRIVNVYTLTRDEVMPIIRQITTQVEQDISKLRTDTALPADMVTCSYQGILENPVFQELVMDENNIYYDDVDALLLNANIAAEEENWKSNGVFARLVLTGNTFLDAELSEVLERVASGAGNESYGTVRFGLMQVLQAIGNGINFSRYMESTGTNYVINDELIVAFFMARGLMLGTAPELKPFMTTALSEDTMRTKLIKLMRSIGSRVNAILKRREEARRHQRLVLYYTTNPTTGVVTAHVNGDIADVWFKSGGTREAILGAAITTKAQLFSELSDKVAEYTRAWDTGRSLNQRRREDAVNMGALSSLVDGLNKQNEARGGTVEDRKKLSTCISDNISYRANWVKTPAEVVRDIVCEMWYSETEVRRFIRCVDELDGTTRTDSALLFTAVVNYVINDWLSDLINISRD